MAKIILIEDDTLDIRTFADLCKDRNICTEDGILPFPTAEAFLTVARATGIAENEFACVFVDLQLDPDDSSDRSGLDAADLVRAEFSDVPIIAYTRHWDAFEMTRLSLHAFDGVLLKQDFHDKRMFSAGKFMEALTAWRRKRGLDSAMIDGVAAPRLARPVILHLSDPQFGRAYANARQLADDVASAVDDDLPNIVVMSGDLAQSGRPEEYRLVFEFLERLCARLQIPSDSRRRVILVPGNHDVNWQVADGFLQGRDSEEEVGTGYADLVKEEGFLFRFAPFYDFYAEFYGEPGGSCLKNARAGYDTFDLRGYGLAIGAVNSSWFEHRGYRRGRIPDHVFESLERDLAKLGDPVETLRMVVFHHPLQIGVGGGLFGGTEDLIEDPPGVCRRLGGLGVQVVFTGHLHSSSVEEIRLETGGKGSSERIYNLLAGSVGVPEDDRPRVGGLGHLPNDFGVLRRNPGEGTWEYEAFSLDVGSRTFLPKPKFQGRKAVRALEIKGEP